MKSTLTNLAIFGGRPSFDEPLHVGRPNIGNRDRLLRRINDILDRKWLSNNGPYVQEFERRIADLIGVKHCIAACNGTVALEIAIRAVGLKGSVIVSAFTAPATVHALEWQGIKPLFCDIDPETLCLDPGHVEKMIREDVSGMVGVHLFGRPCQIRELEEIAKSKNLKLIFDAAHAFGCSINGRMIGNFGDAEVFSFHATKFLNAFEGGAVVTNNDELAMKIRSMKNFGYSSWDTVVCEGTNGKMSEVSAAMGITSLESMDELIAANKRNYHLYREGLKGVPGVHLMEPDDRSGSRNYQYIVLEVDQESARLRRDDLIAVLHAERVLARRYFYPGCHKIEPYRSRFPNGHVFLPVTELAVERIMQLPNGASIGPAEIKLICNIIAVSIENAEKIRRFLNDKPVVSENVSPFRKDLTTVS